MKSMRVATFSSPKTAGKPQRVATEKPGVALPSSEPSPLPPAGALPTPGHSLSLAAGAHVDFGHAVGIADEAHFFAGQFCHAKARAGLREQVLRRHRLKMGVPDAGGLVP